MRRTRFDSVHRVAALREAGARTAAAAAARARVDAQRLADDRAQTLGDRQVAPGAGSVVRASAGVLARLAESVSEAREDVAAREAERQERLAVWSAAARRTRVLDEARARALLADEARSAAAVQRVLDDLAARRGGVR